MASPLEAGRDTSQPQSVGSTLSLPSPQTRPPITKHARPFDAFVRYVLLACGLVSILTTIGIVLVLLSQALIFFNNNQPLTFNIDEVRSGAMSVQEALQALLAEIGTIISNLWLFLTGTKWQPQTGEIGFLPLLNATLLTSFWAIVVALPLGLGSAIYLSNYASMSTRSRLKPILEILAGIPTVTYGFFALTFMTPVLRVIFGPDNVQVYNMLSPALVMGVMILPTIASMSEDAISSVPRTLHEASYGLGATKFETISKVILPAALSGITAAVLVGVSRAIGETMIVAMAAGAGPVAHLTINPFLPGETITGHIARISGGDLPYGSINYNSLFALGLALFAFTFIINILSQRFTKRFREAYQ